MNNGDTGIYGFVIHIFTYDTAGNRLAEETINLWDIWHVVNRCQSIIDTMQRYTIQDSRYDCRVVHDLNNHRLGEPADHIIATIYDTEAQKQRMLVSVETVVA